MGGLINPALFLAGGVWLFSSSLFNSWIWEALNELYQLGKISPDGLFYCEHWASDMYWSPASSMGIDKRDVGHGGEGVGETK